MSKIIRIFARLLETTLPHRVTNRRKLNKINTTIMKRLLSLLLTLCAVTSAFAYTACIDGIYYDFSGTNATVTYRDGNYNSYSGDVVIPATVEYESTTYNVTSIGSAAMRDCDNLKSVTIPNSVTSIGDNAFSESRSITSMTIPNGITTIEYATFSGCSSLVSVILPESVTSIGGYAFQNTSLTTIDLPKNLTNMERYAFCNCSSLQTITIPEGVTSIGKEAFSGCKNLSVTVLRTIPATLGSNAFNENTVFFVPDAETYKAAWTEYENIFSSKVVTASVHLIALSDKSALQQTLGLDSLKKITSLTISGTINSYDIMMMRNQMPNLWEIDLSNANIEANEYEYTKGYCSKKDTISAYSFTGTGTHIRKAVLPNSVVCIEQNVFNTPYLQEVVLPKNLKTIGEKTFYGCSALRTINLPESLTSIGASAFQGAGLTEVTIPANVETIGRKAFAGGSENMWRDFYYSSITSTNKTDGYYLFYDSPCAYGGGSLQSLTIPTNSKLKYISRGAFSGNRSLKNISILGDSIKSIGVGAFYSCELDTLILPPNLTSLSTASFGECTGLKYIVMPNTLTEIADNAFVGCTNLDDVQFPKKLTKIGHHAFADCTNLRNVDIPGLVTDIEEYAFKDCQVKSVYSYLFDPFTIGQNTFSAYANANATLYVPNVEDTEMKYLYDTQWSQFVNRLRMDKSFEYDDFYSKGDVNITCGDDPLKGNPNATIYAGGGLTVEDDGCDTTGLGNITIGGDGADDWGSVIAGCNLKLDSLIQNITFLGKKWYFLGFPFDIRIEDIKTDAKYVIYEYDGKVRAERDTTGWKRLPKTQKYLYPGHGYIFQFNFQKSGDVSILIPSPDFCSMLQKIVLKFYPTDMANNKSWNYVSNPFLGYYDINDLNITTPLTIWDVEKGNYRTVRPGDDDYYFSPYEGFFLQNAEEQDFELTFDRTKAMTKVQMTEHQNSRHNAPARKQQQSTTTRAIINLTLSADSISDNTRIVINENAAMGYELGVDAAKFLSAESNVPQIFSYDDENVQYAINERPMQTSIVELGVRIPASGTYTIDATRMDTTFYLLDRKMNITHDFSTGAYTFSSDAGIQSNRFALVRQYEVPTDTENLTDDIKIDVTNNGLFIHGTADIQVYNMSGIIVAEGEHTGALPLPTGVYMVLANGNTTKCVIR